MTDEAGDGRGGGMGGGQRVLDPRVVRVML